MPEPELYDIISNLNRLNEKLASFMAVEKYKAQSPARKLALEYVDSNTTAKLLHISPRTLAKMRSKGFVPYTRVGRKFVYSTDDLKRVLEGKPS